MQVNEAEGRTRSQATASRTRMVGLDWVKGALVLAMVFYHWMNYFVGPDSEAYRYVRFVTPSFIFLTGFLVSHIYLPRVIAGERGVRRRLAWRGLKLLGIVFALNGIIHAWGTRLTPARMQPGNSSREVLAHLAGFSPMAFSVLVPIAYFLILSAGLIACFIHFRRIFHIVAAVLSALALAAEWMGIQSGYLDMLSFGMLGASIGHLSTETINTLSRQHPKLALAYFVHLYALATWNTLLPLQFVSVILNLLLLYRIGELSAAGRIADTFHRLGEYSLLAYISQIAILQLLRHSLHLSGMSGLPAAYAALFACAAILISFLAVVDLARRQVPAFARLYGAVFA